MKDQIVCKIVDNVFRAQTELVNIEILDTLMRLEFFSWVLSVANLAHHHNIWTFILYMVIELGTSHKLELISVTNVAAEFRAIEASVSLQFT